MRENMLIAAYKAIGATFAIDCPLSGCVLS